MEFLTRKEVAEYFKVHERTVDRWIKNGDLRGYKLGTGSKTLWRFPKSEMKKFLERSNTSSKK